MTDETPDEIFSPLESVDEPLESNEEELADEVTVGDQNDEEEIPMKRCLFCGFVLPVPARACSNCGHALGPFEASTPKEYFHWFFCGLLLFMGGFMPCCHEGTLTITTLSGGIFAIMGLGVMWNMWCAIYAGRLKLLWVLMLFIPAIWGIWRIAFAFKTGTPMCAAMEANGITSFASLSNIFDAPPKWDILRNFLYNIGYGPFMITIGSVLAWCFFVGGMFGAVKHTKKKAAERAASGGRSRRR